jgi:hypothetical protein
MRKVPNKKLTTHFTLYEIIEGADVKPLGHNVNWENFDDFDEEGFVAFLLDIEEVRSEMNFMFRDKNNGVEIGLIVAAGFRHKIYELMQKRSGKSFHTDKAVDVTPESVGRVKMSQSLRLEILEWMYKRYNPVKTGWKGGFAIGWPKPRGRFEKGFAHFDPRQTITRWEYK